LRQAVAAAENQRVGCGFITWSLAKQPGLLDLALAQRPEAVMFSFGDAEPFVEQCREAGVRTIWQVQRLGQARQALASGVDVIVVQGQEAGGHGMDRGLMSLLPAVRDLAGPERVIVAAGGIADGRGLAAALMLGADGVLMGTRFLATPEADAPAALKARLIAGSGDGTVRGKVFDVARDVDWPWEFSGRVMANRFAREWHGDDARLQARAGDAQAEYAASGEDDYEVRAAIAGEAIDLIGSLVPAGEVVTATVAGAVELLGRSDRYAVVR
jgi:nitronate monooxygenase